jgi:hypothetical protein
MRFIAQSYNFVWKLPGLALLCFEVSCTKFIWRYFILRMSILAPLERM